MQNVLPRQSYLNSTTDTVTKSYNLYDTQGNLAQTINARNGNLLGKSAVNAWGEPIRDSAGNVAGAGYGAKFGYIRDGESGFYLCTLRYYDASAGRWLTRDPIGYAGGSNLYGYAGNNPVNGIDPSGLDWLDNASDFSAGWGDTLTLGATDWVRGQMGTNGVINYNSGYYKGGQFAGFVNGAAIDAAAISAARAAQLARAAQTANEAHNAANYARYTEHLKQAEKYGQGGYRELPDGRIRYYGNVKSANKPGEMVGARRVREWCPDSGGKRTWMETVDHSGRIRQVRPETGGPKVHYKFDSNGKYIGKW